MFDKAAPTYDTMFTHSNIGRLQREVVMKFMDEFLDFNTGLKILELNAGTGEDAVYFARKGHQVVVTDISHEMTGLAKRKAQMNGVTERITTIQCDMRDIRKSGLTMEFDLVFSNFGGLNCLKPPELQKLAADLMYLLKPGGRFIAVVMSSFCLWESFYFLCKMKTGIIFRRNSKKGIDADMNGSIVRTWYYSPAGFTRLMKDHFMKIKTIPVGLFIPPSYLEPFFKKRLKLLSRLGRTDEKIKFSALAAFSDHFLIDLERRN